MWQTKAGNFSSSTSKSTGLCDIGITIDASNSSNGSGLAAIDTGNFTTALIQPADGQFLVQQFAAGAPITVSFPQTGRSFGFPDPNGGLVSSFTSYGPTNDMFLFVNPIYFGKLERV